MLTVEQALSAILERVTPLPAAATPLEDALGRVLSEDVAADVDNPPFDNSAVDGYAVRAADTAGARADSPVRLDCVGEVAAGKPAKGEVGAGQCMRVMTGAPMPAGTNAMVMREDATDDQGAVSIVQQAREGDHVRRAGEDFHQGDFVLRAGTLIQAAEIAMLSAVGRPKVSTYLRPRVAVFSTGDELVDLDITPGPGQIRDSNRYTLEALVREAGGEVVISRRVPDDFEATAHALSLAAGLGGERAADVIVTSGGVSVGDHDYVKPALERLGTLDLWRVKMKPGKPLAFGRIDKSLFLGLPGNPVSTMVTFELFVRPVLWRLAGRVQTDRPRVKVTLTDDIHHVPGRREYVRSVLWIENDRFFARATGGQGSAVLTSMLGANGLVMIPEHSSNVHAGEMAEALLLGAPLPGRPT